MTAATLDRPTPAAVRETPMLFTGEMVRAILDGRKSMTRRVVLPQPTSHAVIHDVAAEIAEFTGTTPSLPVMCSWMADKQREDGKGFVEHGVRCPYGRPGDRLWVRETARVSCENVGGGTDWYAIEYAAGGPSPVRHGRLPGRWFPARSHNADGSVRWQPSILVPRWASRLTLEITGVRVERVQAISDADAWAEGVAAIPDTVKQDVARACAAAGRSECGARDYFQRLWDFLNLPRGHGWDANPFVWAISFRRVGGAS